MSLWDGRSAGIILEASAARVVTPRGSTWPMVSFKARALVLYCLQFMQVSFFQVIRVHLSDVHSYAAIPSYTRHSNLTLR